MTPTNTEALAAQAVPALCANCAPAGKCEKRQALCEPGMVAKTAQAVPAAPEQVTVEMLRAGAAEWLKYGEHHAKYPLAQGFESDGICPLQRIEHSRATHVYRAMRAVAPAAPAPEAQAARAALAQRQPLTDEQIESIRAQVFAKALQRCDGCDHETWDHWFARAIEAAHGIAATTGEQR